MSYSNPTVEITYNGNGSDQSFSVNFYYLEGVTSVIQVELWNYTNPEVPVKESFVLGVDYTIDESNYPNTLVNTTDPVAVDYKLVIYRQTVPVQTTNLVNGAFPAESVEEGLDKNMMATQEQYAKLDRALLNPIGGPEVTIQEVLVAAEVATELEARVSQNETDINTINTVSLPAKEPTITATNTDQYYRGDKSFVDLNPAVIASLLTGFVSGAGVVSDTDSILQSIQKLDGNLNDYKWVVNVETVAGTYSVGDREIHIAKSASQTINLPAAALGLTCKIKNAGNYSDVIIQVATSIDGFGTQYTLQSDYESLTLVSDGTQWYIV